jgi:hypothetical protein
MLSHNAARVLVIASVLGALPVPQWAQSLRGSAALFEGDTIESSRPLADIADILQSRYERPVAYEDPIWQWKGDEDRRDVGRDAGRASLMAVVPVRQIFRLPAVLTKSRPTKLSADLLEQILSDYHRQNPGPRFRVLQSKYGLHLVPEIAYDAEGRLGPARNAMDATITVAEATRTAHGHFAAVCAAVSQATGVRVDPSAIGVFEDWYKTLFDAPDDKLTWGASGVTARDALADLLSHSATSFSWQLLCSSVSELPSYGCSLNLQPIRVVRPDANGSPVLVRLEYDRRKQ